MENHSLTIEGVVAMLIVYFLTISGKNIVPGEADIFLKVVLMLGGAIAAWYGRWRKGDITLLGFKKKE